MSLKKMISMASLTSLNLMKSLVFICFVNANLIRGSVATNPIDSSNAQVTVPNESTTNISTDITEVSTQVNTITPPAVSTNATVTYLEPFHVIQEGENVTANCEQILNSSHVSVTYSNRSLDHNSNGEPSADTEEDLTSVPKADADKDLTSEVCPQVNQSVHKPCGGAAYRCTSCATDSIDNVKAGPSVTVMVQLKIVVQSLTAAFVKRHHATYIYMESLGPEKTSHHCSWSCDTDGSMSTGLTEVVTNLGSRTSDPATGCTRYTHHSKLLANPMFNESLLTECDVLCCAKTHDMAHEDWQRCRQINITNSQHLEVFYSTDQHTLKIVGVGLGVATFTFALITLIVFYCCNDPVKKSIRKEKYRQYLRDQERFKHNRRELERRVHAKCPLFTPECPFPSRAKKICCDLEASNSVRNSDGQIQPGQSYNVKGRRTIFKPRRSLVRGIYKSKSGVEKPASRARVVTTRRPKPFSAEESDCKAKQLHTKAFGSSPGTSAETYI